MKLSCRSARGAALLALPFLALSFFPLERANATQPDDESGESADSPGIVLPAWGPGDYRGNFHTGIWPEDVIVWLERENLKALIQDPDLPEEEKAKLKRILAMQMAFAPRVDGEDEEG